MYYSEQDIIDAIKQNNIQDLKGYMNCKPTKLYLQIFISAYLDEQIPNSKYLNLWDDMVVKQRSYDEYSISLLDFTMACIVCGRYQSELPCLLQVKEQLKNYVKNRNESFSPFDMHKTPSECGIAMVMYFGKCNILFTREETKINS